jgi:hypothetical protein
MRYYTEKKKKISDYAKYDKNPYKKLWVRRVLERGRFGRKYKWIKRKGSFVNEKGEVVDEGDLVIGSEYFVDRERFVKLYIGSLRLFAGLSVMGVRLFIEVMRRMERHREKVYLVPMDLCASMGGISRMTYYRALRELLEAEVLARYSGNPIIYYINPAYMFNGDRMVMMRRFVSQEKLSWIMDESEEGWFGKDDDLFKDMQSGLDE